MNGHAATDANLAKEGDVVRKKGVQLTVAGGRLSATRKNKNKGDKKKTKVSKRVVISLEELLSFLPDDERQKVPVEVVYTVTTCNVVWQVCVNHFDTQGCNNSIFVQSASAVAQHNMCGD